METLDSFAQLALMAKAKLVFESENTFLSFPVLSPLSYPPERLKGIKPDGETTPQNLADLSEFARFTNRIPRGVLAPEIEEEYVWDIYREVLTTAQLSSGTMSASERAEYDNAMAFLYVPGSDDLPRRPSAPLTAYNQYRDAHIKAQEEYKSAQLTAETSNDPGVQARWRDTDEERLREAVRRAEEEWLTAGKRLEVEAAQQIERTYAARHPALKWTEWQKSFMADLDTETDTAQISFAPTGFSPYDLFDSGPWPPFTLTRDEMMRLVPQAPPELLAIFGVGPGNSDIESLSFEFRSVAVTRSWFEPDAFKARFWRLGAGAEPLSDGGVPPKGRCPAYIAALVFARHVTVQRRQQPGAMSVPTAVKPGALLRLDKARRVNASLYAAHLYPAAAGRAPQQNVGLGQRVTLQLAAAPTAMLRMRRVDGEGEVPRSFPRVPHKNPGGTTVVVDPVRPPAPPPAPSPSPLPVPSPSPLPPPQPETAPSNEITILAFICKRLPPLCPDPDPALPW